MAHFGADRPIRSISEKGAHDFAAYLNNGYAKATAGRAIRTCKLFFSVATNQNIVHKSPFAKLKESQHANAERQRFIDCVTMTKLMETAPSIEWRVIIALSRFGGLHCPSEHLGLRWGDILWDHNKMWVTSPKTAHYDGGEGRWVPLFPELRAVLDEAFAESIEGAVFVIARNRAPEANWRTEMLRILKRAGLTSWPRLFHNLRGSRQTELVEHFSGHIVCAWMGNSEVVAN